MLAQADALLRAGRFQEAQGAFRQALAQDPPSLDARLGLSQACLGAGDVALATAWLSDACRLAPRRPEPLVRLAELLLGQQQFAQALPLYQRLYHDIGARDRATLLHYGFCLEQVGEVEEAIVLYREAVGREPGFVEAQVDLAGVLWRVGDYQGALAHAQAAVALAPDHPYAVRILGTALLNLGRLDEAETVLRRALVLKPDLALAQVDLAFTLLLAGRMPEGWDWYEKRWNDTARLQRPVYWRAGYEWQGPQQPLAGRSILVYGEQGLGDQVQFARYLPLLQALGATVLAALRPELLPLVERSFPGVRGVTATSDVQADLHVALLDLPQRLRTTLDSIPSPAPYLHPPAERLAHWQHRLSAWPQRLRVGLAWAGFAAHVNDRNRSLPLSLFRPLLESQQVQCFSLQKSAAGAYRDMAPAPGRLLDLTAEWTDCSDSAAMLRQLDLVITVDSAVAHLAGAVGTPVWLLLPPNPDFRWLLDRADSPWYRGMRLFRRNFGESRQDQVARVLQALQDRLAA
ncbi:MULTISPECIES: tetratricopeptide repeat protein [Ramlibacter]|uniref:Tetratricopeptide repeat protein n=1 Tax=Ramlibacter pinisoli TaxID=2682844 RepID=A0A6N8IP93_9BURK|nr:MULTISPECIES: tetratricopeptide repeat protein [Ramlibacter]MBA2963715.1 tetratricopeptide repeat protein [Ramlibacter sp. CGMCC 1.13660]MVQ28681.1 tetratricopeptide repeat protein [Ramlibacter pinisoli]